MRQHRTRAASTRSRLSRQRLGRARRALGLLLVAGFLAAQGASLAHRLSHNAVSHDAQADDGSCVVCRIANEAGHGLAVWLPLAIETGFEPTCIEPPSSGQAPLFERGPHAPRAPPIV